MRVIIIIEGTLNFKKEKLKMIKIGDKILDQDLNITSEYRTKEELEKINRGHGEGEVIKTFSLNHFFVRFEGIRVY